MTTTITDVSSPNSSGHSETALLLDWYSLFVEKVAGPSAEPALKVAIKLRKWAKTQNITVVHCLIDANAELTFHRVPGHISALKSPGLLDYLKEKGIKSLVLTGLSTPGCVLRTAVAATDAEFATTVISDACADTDGEIHQVILNKIITSRGHVKSSSEFQKEFQESQRLKLEV
ncbi:hypothetical protein FNYG_08182 [Fusarium nygamai]|uniref:Isochorismatase-like domain-containing protein n=1 Tax=Gibberella nygamai TaxID=42673 RepID=A0A2K0W855_GIBNY|nr:hypothetical protein FNYG_08182 [Fusarium nygamai]